MPRQEVNPSLHIFRSPRLQSVVREAMEFLAHTPVHSLPPNGRFNGPGVYMLYYLGNFEHYTQIARANRQSCNRPIYVGKAVPSGWRTARSPKNPDPRPLQGRLREHTRSIRRSTTLEIGDFRCRFIILENIETDLITVIEAHLVREYLLLWNSVVDGFGNHDPGKGRYDQAPSEWDVLHPGRPWVAKLTGIPPRMDNIISKIEQYRPVQ